MFVKVNHQFIKLRGTFITLNETKNRDVGIDVKIVTFCL